MAALRSKMPYFLRHDRNVMTWRANFEIREIRRLFGFAGSNDHSMLPPSVYPTPGHPPY